MGHHTPGPREWSGVFATRSLAATVVSYTTVNARDDRHDLHSAFGDTC